MSARRIGRRFVQRCLTIGTAVALVVGLSAGLGSAAAAPPTRAAARRPGGPGDRRPGGHRHEAHGQLRRLLVPDRRQADLSVVR